VVDSVEPLGAGVDQAVLVRPDGIVAWRGVATPHGLSSAYRQILARH